MKRIIATTAMALMLGTSAMAASHTGMAFYKADAVQDVYASEFIGMRVYAAEKDFDTFNNETMLDEGAETEWDDIGEIDDVILGRDGNVKAVIIGVGGFLGIGEKDVAVNMDQIKFVNEKDDPGDFFLVTKLNKQTLTDAETFTRDAMMKDEAAKEEMAENQTAENTETKDDMVTMDDGSERRLLMRPTVDVDGYEREPMEALTAERLTGAVVYDANDANIGEIDSIILADDGKSIKHVIVDVGGFLGIGEKPIAVTLDELEILRQTDGDDIKVYIDGTKAALEEQPAYKG